MVREVGGALGVVIFCLCVIWGVFSWNLGENLIYSFGFCVCTCSAVMFLVAFVFIVVFVVVIVVVVVAAFVSVVFSVVVVAVVVVVVKVVIVPTVLSSAVGVVSFDTSSVTIHPVSSSRRADRKLSVAMSLSFCSYASISLRRWRSSFADRHVPLCWGES